MASNPRIHYFEKLNLSKFTGFTLAEKINKKETIRLWLLPFIAYLYLAIIMFRKWSLADDIDDFLYTTALANVVPRMTIIRINRSRLVNILVLLKDLKNFDSRHGKEVKLYKKKIVNKLGVALSQLGVVAVVVSLVGWYFSNKDGTLPFGSMPRWALEYNFTLCVVFQVVLITLLGQDYVMVDAIKWSILLQLRVHLKYFKCSISDLEVLKGLCGPNLPNKHTNDGITSPWSNLKKYIKYITVKHNLICSIANETNATFNKCVFVSFLNISFLFCFILLNMSKVATFNMEFYKLLCYLLIHLLLFCGDTYLCQQVVTESEGLVQSFYEIDFIGSDIRFQKALVFLMTRAQKTITFTIGNFSPLSMATIVTVLNASISYFVLLRNLEAN